MAQKSSTSNTLMVMVCLAIVASFAWAFWVAIGLKADARETAVQETYSGVWTWCQGRFPYREDLQEACRWGAYEMIPGQDTPAKEKDTQDA